METLLQLLLNGIKDLETCIFNAKQVILQEYEDDSVVQRLSFYDQALSKINNEIESINSLNNSENYDEIDQSVKRIVQLSNMIKQDTIDLLLMLETGFDSGIDVESWN